MGGTLINTKRCGCEIWEYLDNGGEVNIQYRACDNHRDEDHQKEIGYYQAGVDQDMPAFVPKRVVLRRQIRGDFPIGHKVIAWPGVRDAHCNSLGAVSVGTTEGKLGLRLDEFEVISWQPNPHLKKRMPDNIPEGYWKIDTYTNGYEIIVCGDPLSEDQYEEAGISLESPLAHNCDAMGCTSVSHVIYRVSINHRPPPEMWPGFNVPEWLESLKEAAK